MYDILIKNGLIVNGLGSQPYNGTIAIKNGKIHKITSKDNGYKAHIEIEANGKIITPGFIDISNHSDTYLTLLSAPSQKSLITQGVTTIVGGNCGASLAPLISNSAIGSIQKWTDMSNINIDWHTFKEYLAVLKNKSFAPNFASLVGYDTVRRGLIGDENRALTDAELKIIANLIHQSLEEGAIGVSLGLAFSHMQSVDKKELLQLANIIKKYNKILTVHSRNDGEQVVESIKEIIYIVSSTKVNTHINHLKILGKKNWKYATEINEILTQAILDKLPLTFDIFPYTANNTVAYLLLPRWVSIGGRQVLIKNLQDSNIRAKLVQEMKSNSYDYTRMIVSDSPMNKSIIGKNIVEIAKNQSLSVEDAVIHLVLASEGRGRVIVDSISSRHMNELILFNNSMIGSDSAGYDDNLIKYKNYEHPRSFGAFTKFLQDFVLTGKLTWQQAIPKITSLPAKIFGLDNIGVIQENMHADLVILDPINLQSCANFQQPIQYSIGIEVVIINGKITLQGGQVIDLAGRVINS
ncbi:MAG: N-acyl-D-amino-acid deacylase family protein [Minisyncoccia bacterium]